MGEKSKGTTDISKRLSTSTHNGRLSATLRDEFGVQVHTMTLSFWDVGRCAFMEDYSAAVMYVNHIRPFFHVPACLFFTHTDAERTRW
jgi:hypothetical protein